MTTLANWLVENKYEVVLCTLAAKNETPFYSLDSRVCLINLNLARASKNIFDAIWSNLIRIRHLRYALKLNSANVTISFVETLNIQILISAIGLGFPIVVSERTNPSEYRIGRIWNFLRQRIYPKASRVVVQTGRVAEYFKASCGIDCTVIPNSIGVPKRFVKDLIRSRKIIALGRLDTCKQFDLLMRAFDLAAQDDKDWSLEIWGEGADRARLELLRKELHSGSRISLPGTTADANETLAEGAFFVLSSRFEGFPNALCEAMACGLPAISFDCASGPKEIIRDGIDGRLVPPNDVQKLSAAMKLFMQNDELRVAMGEMAREVIKRFGTDAVMSRWDDVIREVTCQ